MSRYVAAVRWERKGHAFLDNRYSRAHVWSFDGGVDVPASSSPQVVPLPFSQSAAVDPEEAFVASLSSCHMLWFLSIAAKSGFVVDRYEDEAEGTMAEDSAGRLAFVRVTLRPLVSFASVPGSPTAPTRSETDAMHEAAHAECFLARSVRCEVACEPR